MTSQADRRAVHDISTRLSRVHWQQRDLAARRSYRASTQPSAAESDAGDAGGAGDAGDDAAASYARRGVALGVCPPELARALCAAFVPNKASSFRCDDIATGYRGNPKLSRDDERAIDAQQQFFALDADDRESVSCLLSALRPEIEQLLGRHWEVVNVRAWSTCGAASAGAAEWHRDGFPECIRKLMLFPSGADLERGTTEVEARDGESVVVSEASACWLLFDSGVLRHRSRPGRGPRPCIEVTLAPSIETSVGCVVAGANAQYPWVPETSPAERDSEQSDALVRHFTALTAEVARAHSERDDHLRVLTVLRANAVRPPRQLNLGGGPRFLELGWENLEAVFSAENPRPFRFSERCRFPVEPGSIDRIFSSHNLEHLAPRVVERVLAQAFQALRPGGRLVVVLPDYDRALDAWRAGRADFFGDREWNFPALTRTWGRWGVEDGIDTRAAALFCSYWNAAYGDRDAQFSGATSDVGRAYFGPARMRRDELAALARLDDPSEIADKLRDHVVSNETDYSFCHQSAWGRKQLEQLLQRHGFVGCSFDAEAILGSQKDVPGIARHAETSLYCLCTRPADRSD